MPLWSTIPGTRIPSPKQRPEQKAALHQYRAVVQGKLVPTSIGRKYRRSTLDHPWGGSDNWSVADASLDAINGNPCRAWWEAVLRSYEAKGHHHAEWCSINYSERTFLSLAITVAYLQDPDHPAAEILRRDLLLFAILARPIVARDGKGRVVYEGFGWRRAGLRSTANHWSSWLDSYLMARILGLEANVTARGKRQEREFVEMVEKVFLLVDMTLVHEKGVWVEDVPNHLQMLTKGVGIAARQPQFVDRQAVLRRLASPLRTPPGMSAILARDVQTGETFSCLLGTRVGNNTASTAAVYCKGPELVVTKVRGTRDSFRVTGDCEFAYPWPGVKPGTVDGRVRTGALKKAGPVTGRLVPPDREGDPVLYNVWSTQSADSLRLPPWLYDDTRAIRLEVFHDKPAVLSLPGAARPGGGA